MTGDRRHTFWNAD